MIIKDFDDAIFGAFCTENWHMALEFYGNGESFLFKYKTVLHTYFQLI